KNLYLSETILVGWAALAQNLNYKIFSHILPKFLEIMDCNNSFHVSLTFHLIKVMAKFNKITVWDMFMPHFPNISKNLIIKMKSNRLFANDICELLGCSETKIVFEAANYAIPLLIQHYENDYIMYIAELTGISKYKLVNQKSTKILGYLFATTPLFEGKVDINKIKMIMANCLLDFDSPEYKKKKMELIWEILMHHDGKPSSLPHILSSLVFIAKHFFSNCEKNRTDEAILKDCFDNYILGIVRNFSDIFIPKQGFRPFCEKQKSLLAIQALIIIAVPSIVATLPQICTSLQLSIEDPLLVFDTLQTWKILVEKLENVHLVSFLDLVVSIIIQRWRLFDQSSKKIGTDILHTIFSNSELMKGDSYYHYYLSLADQEDLLSIYLNTKRNLISVQNDSSFSNLLSDISRRCLNDNKYVVKQSLKDLSKYLDSYVENLYTKIEDEETIKESVIKLINILLETGFKFKLTDFSITRDCVKCLGTLGKIAYSKLTSTNASENKSLLVLHNFDDKKESIIFLIRFIDKFLVKSFWASTNPSKQLLLAYSMQEYLKFCGLSSPNEFLFLKSPSNNLEHTVSPESILWNKFSDVSKSTLIPLISSKYVITPKIYQSLKYPIFDVLKKHEVWLREFTFHLCDECTGKYSKFIFQIGSRIIKDQNLEISQFILPYIALNVLTTGSEETKNNIKTEILSILKIDAKTYLDQETNQNIKQCYQTVFSILDYFKYWLISRQRLFSSVQSQSFKDSEEMKIVSLLLNEIPEELIADRAYQCCLYERAILYLEQLHRTSKLNNSTEVDSIYSSLQQMYANINDSDALTGILKHISTNNLNDKILQLQYNDNWKMSLDCFEGLDNTGIIETKSLYSFLETHNLSDELLSKLGGLVKAKNHLSGIESGTISLGLSSYCLQGSISDLKRWVLISEIQIPLNKADSLVDLNIAKSLLYFNKNNNTQITNEVDEGFKAIGKYMNKSLNSPATMNLLKKLHLLEDINIIAKATRSKDELNKGLKRLNMRYRVCENKFDTRWNFLRLRKSLESMRGDIFKNDISKLWIQCSELSREHHRVDLASKSIAHVLSSEDKDGVIEYSRVLWELGDQSKALKLLQNLLNEYDNNGLEGNNCDDEYNFERAKIVLQHAKWLDISGEQSSLFVINSYKKAIEYTNKKWEKAFFYLGKYYSKLLDSESKNKNTSILFHVGRYELHIVNNYLKAVELGTENLNEILPKILTIWFDFENSGSNLYSNNKIINKRKQVYKELQQLIDQTFSRIPIFVLYVIFSQLISKICHENSKTCDIIISNIIKITNEYPKHALWSIFSILNSNDKNRKNKATLILKKLLSMGKINELISKAKILIDGFFIIKSFDLNHKSKKRLSKKHVYSLKEDFNFDHSILPIEIVLPIEKNFEIKALPTDRKLFEGYTPFPEESCVSFQKFEDKVEILFSLQKPRKIKILGSDGKHYYLMCKPNDDLRKDAKVMEFTTLIDQLLKKNFEAIERELSIKRYAVIPLSEEYGIIEFVSNQLTIRSVLFEKYNKLNKYIVPKKIEEHFNKGLSLSKKLKNFERYLNKFQPVLYLWFLERFSNPLDWYNSRNKFSRSCGVMSIIGFIIGLGDRHGENILIDSMDGGLLHVDFDCIFDKGETLAVPERVPFRLTNNLVDGMSKIYGYDGTFLKSCEVVLKVIRRNESGLINILESLIYDSIMEFQSKEKREIYLNKIRKKISGIFENEGLPLNVKGEVKYLCEQATDAKNLCQMYFGWLPFI
ncbi:protein kinase MEC1 ASCRUDRAFT_18548, partial [Ascoidea rubescens DSM 1968]